MSGPLDYLLWLPIGLAALVFAAILGAVWWKWSARLVPRSIRSPRERAELADDYRKTIAQFVGGIGFVATFFFTIYQFQVQHRQSVTQQANQQFVDAAKLLKETDSATQAAGLHAMARLAETRQEYVVPVLHTITSYIKGRRSPERTKYPAGVVARNKETGEIYSDYPANISQDVQAAVFVLKRLQPPAGLKIDLQHAYLVHADFSSAEHTYIEADFSGASLYGADFRSADLTKVHFDGAHMADWEAYNIEVFEYEHVREDHVVHFAGANLTGATFDHVWIGYTDFKDACLAGTQFWDTDLSRALFKGAKLPVAGSVGNCSPLYEKGEIKRVNFVQARLNQVDFKDMDLRGVSFDHACLAGTIFSGAKLSGASFKFVDLGDAIKNERCIFKSANGKKIKASFDGANLKGAHFDGVDIGGVSFVKANLSAVDFSDARNFGQADFTGACMETGMPPKTSSPLNLGICVPPQ